MVNKNPLLFVDPQITYPDKDLSLSFDDYIAQCQRLIQATRLDLGTHHDAKKIIAANSPFELKPTLKTRKPQGILLIHGLYASPSTLLDMGLAFQRQGYLVRSVLLPGHGTVPGALLNVTYKDWIQTVNYGIHSLLQEVDSLFLVGYSTGGTLALHHALTTQNPAVLGLILLSPAIQIKSKLACMAGLHKCISWTFKKAAWLGQLDEDDYAKYQSCTFNSIQQIYQLCKRINQLARPIAQPIFAAITQRDTTVCSDATLKFFANQASPNSQLILYTNNRHTPTDQRITQRPTANLTQHIADYSHVCLATSPLDNHYGTNGDYVTASRIAENLHRSDYVIYDTSNTFDEIISSWLYRSGMIKHQRLRMTFNPDFDGLLGNIFRFLV
jgi:esterase/lipase